MLDLIGVLIIFLPLLVIMWVANLAENNRQRGESAGGLALVSYVLASGLYALAVLIGGGIQASTILIEQQPNLLADAGIDMTGNPLLQNAESLTWLGAGVWISGVVGIILLFPFVRRLIARLIPGIDPDSPVHAIALSFISLILINLAFTLGIGLGNLSTALQEQAEATGGIDQSGTILALWVQQACTALLALVGVGWLVRRGWSESLRRLGVTSLTRDQMLLGVGLGVALVPMVMVLEYALNALFGITVDPDVDALTEQLLGPLFNSPFGILTLGLAAALGEEPIFRGAVQPRFGLFLTAALFAVVHSNYGITLSTLVVLLLGLVLGIIRQRHNTSTAMIVHAVYNISLGLLAYLSLNFLDNF